MNPEIPSPDQPEERSHKEHLLTPEEMRERLRDPSFLPSYYDLVRLFEPYGGAGRKNRTKDPEWHKWTKLLEDDKHRIFEFWTKEFIELFSTYLAERAEVKAGTTKHPTVILEVGAGNGHLTHFLQGKMNEVAPGKVTIIATDSGQSKIVPDFPVETVPYDEALVRYKPHIIISSWMPHGKDFTGDFRASPNVDEYLLIGEADSGVSGDEWLTWGISDPRDAEEGLPPEPPPYQADGFEKEYLDNLSKFQLSQLAVTEGTYSSQTVSFRRR